MASSRFSVPTALGIKIVEGDGGGTVVRGLGGRVYNGGGFDLPEEVQHALAIADIEFMMAKRLAKGRGKAALVPACITLGPEENGPLIIVHPMNFPAKGGEVNEHFGADEAGGSGDK